MLCLVDWTTRRLMQSIAKTNISYTFERNIESSFMEEKICTMSVADKHLTIDEQVDHSSSRLNYMGG